MVSSFKTLFEFCTSCLQKLTKDLFFAVGFLDARVARGISSKDFFLFLSYFLRSFYEYFGLLPFMKIHLASLWLLRVPKVSLESLKFP